MLDLISIIVPVYNNNTFLPDCVSSIKAQSYSPIECIIVDDGSDEEYRDFYDSFSDDMISVYHIKKAGVAEARNYGMTKAQGEYICFIDSDDIVAEHYCSRLHNLIIDTNADISAGGYRRFRNTVPNLEMTGGGYKTKKLSGDDIWLNILHNECSAEGFLWNKLFRKELLQGLTFDKTLSMSEDLLFVFQAVERSDSLVVTDEPVYFYRTSNQGATALKNYSMAKGRQSVDVAERILEMLRDSDVAVVEGYKKYLAGQAYAYCCYLARRHPDAWKKELVKYREICTEYCSSGKDLNCRDGEQFLADRPSWYLKMWIKDKAARVKNIMRT